MECLDGWQKSIVTHYLDKDVEGYKLILKAENDFEVEKFKHKLEKATAEHKVRFEKLHEHRDYVIATLYSRIVEFYQAIGRFFDTSILLEQHEIEEEAKLLWRAVDSFRNFSEKNRIYFSEDICKRIDKLCEAVDEPTGSLVVATEYSGMDGYDSNKLIALWQEARDVLAGDIKMILKALENDFRELLGVDR